LAFDYFLMLRNKHIVHDENSYAQSIPGAAINRGDKDYKVEKIICLAAHGNTLEQANYSNLKLLIERALTWVISEFDKCCDLLTSELESLSYQELAEKPDVSYQVPDVGDIGGNRRGRP